MTLHQRGDLWLRLQLPRLLWITETKADVSFTVSKRQIEARVLLLTAFS